MLLRDERQMSVGAVETLCIESADHYASGATQAGDTRLAQLFEALAQQRRAFAGELAAHIRALDDLPQTPDPDREAVAHAISGIKAYLSGGAALIDERMRGELALAEAAQAALRQTPPGESQELLRRILAHAQATADRLAAWR
jgi:uncharacterized protein (TIGR02284 family)